MRELNQNSKFCYHLFILDISLPFTSPAGQIRRYDTFFHRVCCFFCPKWAILRCTKSAVGQWPKCVFDRFFDQKQNFMTYRLIYSFPPMSFAGFMVKVLIVVSCIVISDGYFRSNCVMWVNVWEIISMENIQVTQTVEFKMSIQYHDNKAMTLCKTGIDIIITRMIIAVILSWWWLCTVLIVTLAIHKWKCDSSHVSQSHDYADVLRVSILVFGCQSNQTCN